MICYVLRGTQNYLLTLGYFVCFVCFHLCRVSLSVLWFLLVF